LSGGANPGPLVYDQGACTVTINGTPYSTAFGQGDNTNTITSRLAGVVNGGSLVSDAASGATESLTAKISGTASNYSLSATCSHDSANFSAGSFAASTSGSSLAGGTNPGPPTVDSGMVTLNIGSGFSASACYGPSGGCAAVSGCASGDSTATQIACVLGKGLSASGSPVTPMVSGSSISMVFKTLGLASNVAVNVVSSPAQPSVFPGGSFSGSAMLSGGTDPVPASLQNPYVTLYSYDTLGNLLRVDQKGSAPTDSTKWRTRLFTYDSLSRLLTAYNPESGMVSYSYDTDGNLMQKTSPQANQTGTATTTISYCYDELHRVTGKWYSAFWCQTQMPQGPAAVSYVYDAGANGKGRLTSLTDQAGSATYSYDVLGRLSSEQRTIAGTSKTVSYDYNLDGSVKVLHYPSGAAVTYTPDSAGRILSAVDTANAISYVTGATYGPDSALTGFVSGNTGGFAGITNTVVYNNRLQPCRITASITGAVPTNCLNSWGNVLDLAYDFHLGSGDNGNVWGITNYRDQSRNQSFTYDALNRLTSAQNAGTDCSVTLPGGRIKFWGNNYGYDAWGNLLSKSVTKCGAENLSVTAGNDNRLQTGYTYDAAGNMIHDATSGLNYNFDQENRITGAAGYTYTYDADGNRVEKSNGSTGTLYWYMSPGIVGESDLSGNLTAEYVFFDGERVARKDLPGNAVSYYFSDHLKTASVITDSAGNIKSESDYYPWGGELQFVNNDSNHYKFTGKERDLESGLDYFGARYYSNGLGRFVSADWSATPEPVPYADLGDPQSLNLYTYVRNVPTSKADRDGHCDTPAGLGSGQVGICIASYIRTTFFHFPGRGDGRKANPHGGTSRVEVRLIVDPKNHTVKITYDYVGRSGVGCKDCGFKGGGGSTVSKPTVDGKGNTDFQVAQHGESFMNKLTLGSLGTIDNHINLQVEPNGIVHVAPGSTARDYPSLEGFSYTLDKGGNTTSTQLINKIEASHNDNNGDLKKRERPISSNDTSCGGVVNCYTNPMVYNDPHQR